MGRLTALCLALALFTLAGCGAGGDQEESSTVHEAMPKAEGKTTQAKPQANRTNAPEPSSGAPASSFSPRPHHDSVGGSKQFTAPGADNSVEEFGTEAKGEEFQAAATALHGLLDARAQRNWVAACEYLARPAKLGLEQLGAKVPELRKAGCPAQLGALTGSSSSKALREAAIADVTSVRVQGDHGVLIYRGAHGQLEAITMAREGGKWKVASLSAAPLG